MAKPGEIQRAKIIEVLRDSHGPQTAYEILNALRDTNPKIAPTTVYRALNTLVEAGHLHRLESMNAYILCQDKSCSQKAILSICDDCGSVDETVDSDLLETMTQKLSKTGFASTRHIIEVHGICANCEPENAN